MKKLYYRGNVFLAKDKNYTVLRIDKKVFKIPKDKFLYEDILLILTSLSTPKDMSQIDSRQLYLIKFLLKVGALVYDEMPTELNSIQEYFIRNYSNPSTLYKKWINTEVGILGKGLSSSVFEDKKKFFMSAEHGIGKKIFVIYGNTKSELKKNLRVARECVDDGNIILVSPIWVENETVAISFYNSYKHAKQYVEALDSKNTFMMNHLKEKVIMNYIFLLAMDSLSDRHKFKNFFLIKDDLEIKNISFTHFTKRNFIFRNKKIDIDKVFTTSESINHLLVASNLIGEFKLKTHYDDPKIGNCSLSFKSSNKLLLNSQIEGKNLEQTIKKEVISVLKKYFKSYDYEVDIFIGKESLQGNNTITSQWLIWPEMENSGVFIRKK